MPWYVYAFVFVELVIVAWIDFKVSKISNYWTIINVLAFVLLSIFLPNIYIFSIKTFFLPLAWLLAGYMLFTLDIMGAGDSKYLFSIFILLPYAVQDLALYTLIYSTVTVGVMSFLITVYQNKEKLSEAYRTKSIELIKGVFGKKFTYAPVILMSWVWFGILAKVWK